MSTTAQQRRAGVAVDRAAREPNDFYPTPPAATRALLAVEPFTGPIWEPACGDGAISRVLAAAGHHVVSTDLVDRGYGEAGVDFLMQWQPRAPDIVTNPPFKLGVPFLRQALRLATGKVAFLQRLACLEGVERGALYEQVPLARVWVFSRRLSIYRRGEVTGANGMVAFAWFVFEPGHQGRPTLGWLDHREHEAAR